MIAGISMGKSFSGCLGYCLEDKQDLTEEQKMKSSLKDGVQHANRAEVLAYNQCFGDQHELAAQFNDVRKLSRKVEKPVLHLSMRLAPGEHLNKDQWLHIAEEIVKEMGVANNQYLVVRHHDTKEEHIHIVVNRVGYDGRAASSSNNYYRMDKLCRRLELKYQLHQVLSPRQFLPKEMRQLPRHDTRKEQMKKDIGQTLAKAKDYEDFSGMMQSLGYKIIRGRGITFIDDKKVMAKGSELGYSLMTIEKTLQLNQERNLKLEEMQSLVKEVSEHRQGALAQLQGKLSAAPLEKTSVRPTSSESVVDKISNHLNKGWADALQELTQAGDDSASVNPELQNESTRKKKKKPRLHL